jgi:hypothetical protein
MSMLGSILVLVVVKHDDPGDDSSDNSCEDSQLRIIIESPVYSDRQCVHKLDMSHSSYVTLFDLHIYGES